MSERMVTRVDVSPETRTDPLKLATFAEAILDKEPSRIYMWDEAFLTQEDRVAELNVLLSRLGLRQELKLGEDLLILTDVLNAEETKAITEILQFGIFHGWLVGVWNSSGQLCFAYSHHDFAFWA